MLKVVCTKEEKTSWFDGLGKASQRKYHLSRSWEDRRILSDAGGAFQEESRGYKGIQAYLTLLSQGTGLVSTHAQDCLWVKAWEQEAVGRGGKLQDWKESSQ